jgi:4-amino-4-deoxy-L-arabinose transferase-like glycosyltransferase
MGYADYVAEAGRPPRAFPSPSAGSAFSDEYVAALEDLPFSVEGRPSWSPFTDRELRRRLEEVSSERPESAAFTAATYPPLYYAFEAIPATLGASLDVLDRLYLMRLFSATLAGITVASSFLFLRELFPATPWTWTVGALAVAFQPVFGFMSGGVNNDGLLYATGSMLFLLLARSFRLGLTPRRGLAIGAVAAAGLLTKTTVVGLFPGAALGLVLLWRRAHGSQRRTAAGGLLAAGAMLGAVTAAWFAVDTLVFDRSLATATGGLASDAIAQAATVRGQLSYLWQFFLPPLPFMTDTFSGYPDYPVWDVYIQGFIGRFGFFQYGFPSWVNRLGLGVLLAVAALAGVALVRRREALRRRWPELCCYAAMLFGTLLVIGVAGYRYRLSTGFNFEQTRYLFTLLPLYGALVALAAQGVGRRWGHTAGAVLVVVVVGHTWFAMLLTINRYYV